MVLMIWPLLRPFLYAAVLGGAFISTILIAVIVNSWINMLCESLLEWMETRGPFRTRAPKASHKRYQHADWPSHDKSGRNGSR